MAIEHAGLCVSLPAHADYSTKQFYFMKVSSAGKAQIAAAGEQAIGVLQNKPDAADRAAAVQVDGVTKVIAGGVIAPGARVACNVDGKAVTATAATTDTTSGAASDPLVGSYVMGIALNTANCASGDIIPVLLLQMGAVPTTVA